MIKNPLLEIDRSIIGDSGTSSELESNLYAICDDIGPRFPGTEGYRSSADYMLEKFREYGFEKAELEAFTFNGWRRGTPARFSLTSPRSQDFECYAMPYSGNTGPEGIEAGIIDLDNGDTDQFEKNKNAIKGKFVLTTCKGTHRTVVYESCVEHGAVGFIFMNMAPGNHLVSGTVANGESGKIPAVCIGFESGSLIQRILSKNSESPRFHLFADTSCEPDTTWNVVAELPGTEFPDELVIIGGHLDSHEIGPGAYDNGAGSVMVLETARILASQREHLKRPVRFILFGAEEIGLLGSHYHAKAHAEELKKARFMMNCDMPALGSPRGLAFHECPKGEAYLEKLSEQMDTKLICQNRAHCHSDHYPFILQGLPTAGIAGGPFSTPVNHFGHGSADTPEKMSYNDLQDCAELAARVLIRIANDEDWPDMRRTQEEIDKFGK